jgi:hypothetical protein
LERFYLENGGAAGFYAVLYLTEQEFWTIHDRKHYLQMREKLNAKETFVDMWEKLRNR